MAKWTRESLKRALRKQLASRSTALLKTPLETSRARGDWTAGQRGLVIRVDESQIGLVPAVVHELVHYVLQDDLSHFSEELEEVLVNALEVFLCEEDILKSRPTTASWRRAIRRKLKEA